ncbi:MAG TPA: EAL domain-containing protein [Terracidiphilus sp.]|jgi:PAS domain S-box-containing protein
MVFDETDIRRAFDEGEFFPVFQPLVELRTGRLAGFEILARWKHKKFGAISPDDFIPLVEESGLIDILSRRLLECAFASPVLTGSAYTLALNISPRQLLGYKLPERVAAAAKRGNFPLDRLVIEITESALLDDLPRAQAVAAELKALNCKLALDDFGTGYSSLRHLQALPFDEIKIDRSFVNSMTVERESRKIVAAVVGLGQSLGLTTVAEGVETEEQARMLAWLGCDLSQGWHHGRPLPAEDLPRLVFDLRARSSAPLPPPIDGGDSMSRDVLPAQRLAQLQAIYDGAPVGLCLLDRNLRYVSLNQRLAQLNGLPVAAHLGRPVAEVIPSVFPLVESYIRRALQGEPVSGVEVQRPPEEDGREGRTLLLSYQPARDEADEILGVSVAMMDITGSKQTERALRESENHYRHMMQLSPHIPWVLNRQGEVTEASSRWESFTGQPLEEASGHGWQKMLHPDDVEPARAAIRLSLTTGDPIDIEYRVRRLGADWTRMRSRGSPRFDPAGEVVCIYGVVEEVEGQKQTSEELRNSQAELRAAVEAVPIGMIFAGAHDLSVYAVNPAADRIFHGTVFPGQTLAECGRLGILREDGQAFSADELPLSKAVLRGETVTGKRALYQRDGARMHLELSGKPIYSDCGLLIGGLMMVRERAPQD